MAQGEIADIQGFMHQHRATGRFLAAIVAVPQNQRGPNCGYYALNLVHGYWSRLGDPQQVLPARKGDVQPRAPLSLRQLGMRAHVNDDGNQPFEVTSSRVGGMFNGNEIVRISQLAGWTRTNFLQEAVQNNYIDTIVAAIDRGLPVIVGYDVRSGGNQSGCPADLQGEHAHYATVFGYYSVNQQRRFVAKHWGRYFYWEAALLYASSNQMQQFSGGNYGKIKVVNSLTHQLMTNSGWEAEGRLTGSNDPIIRAYAQDVVNAGGVYQWIHTADDGKGRATYTTTHQGRQVTYKRYVHPVAQLANLRHSIVVIEPQTYRVALQGSRWNPDNDHAACQICHQAFKWNRRRHHCRRCGRVVCDACSAARRQMMNPLTANGIRSGVHNVRICDGCAPNI